MGQCCVIISQQTLARKHSHFLSQRQTSSTFSSPSVFSTHSPQERGRWWTRYSCHTWSQTERGSQSHSKESHLCRQKKKNRIPTLCICYIIIHPERQWQEDSCNITERKSLQYTYLLMYSPVSVQPHVRHLKQVTCHCLSSASRDWPCLISSPQPAQSGWEERQESRRAASLSSTLSLTLLSFPHRDTRTGLQDHLQQQPTFCVCVCACVAAGNEIMFRSLQQVDSRSVIVHFSRETSSITFKFLTLNKILWSDSIQYFFLA